MYAASLKWTTLTWIIKDCLLLSSSCVSPSTHRDRSQYKVKRSSSSRVYFLLKITTHTIPESSTGLDLPPTLPLLSPPVIPASPLPPLSPVSPSAHPQPTICALDSPRVCQSPSVSWLEDPLHPHSASASVSTTTCSGDVSRPPGVVSATPYESPGSSMASL